MTFITQGGKHNENVIAGFQTGAACLPKCHSRVRLRRTARKSPQYSPFVILAPAGIFLRSHSFCVCEIRLVDGNLQIQKHERVTCGQVTPIEAPEIHTSF